MSRDYTYTKDKSGRRIEKTYSNKDGTKEHWKTDSGGTPIKGPYKEHKSGNITNPYGRIVGRTKKY